MSVKRYQPVAQCVEPSYQAQMIVPKVMEFSEGEYVLHSDYARLKAEVENSNRINTELLLLSNQQASEVRRLTAELSNISGWGRGLESDLSHARVEILFLKAEVERLSAADSYLQGANEYAYEKRCDELEAENERLTEDNRQLKKAFEIAEGIIKRMGNAAENAAKEGKQP